MADISLGNVLMLSQVAWRAGRSFRGTSCRTLPYAFREVELELSRVARSLKLLAETLFSEDAETLIDQSSPNTQDGIASVIELCRNTLESLESLIEQYQFHSKNPSRNDRGAEWTWSDLVVQNHDTLMWTPDGGTLRDLRELLHMLTSTTALIRQALDRCGGMRRTLRITLTKCAQQFPRSSIMDCGANLRKDPTHVQSNRSRPI